MRSRTEFAREIQLTDGKQQETCLTGPLEYKHRVIIVLVAAAASEPEANERGSRLIDRR